MNNNPVKILLIEDNPGDVRLTQEIFKDAGLDNELEVAKDGEEALQILGFDPEDLDGVRREVTDPDIIVIDLNLPKLDGRELIEILKSHYTLKEVPLIILTTSLDDRHLTVSHMLHARSYIEKPLDVPSLVGALQGYPQFGLKITRRAAELSDIREAATS